jgi:hypothetical protein
VVELPEVVTIITKVEAMGPVRGNYDRYDRKTMESRTVG